ncbi:F0F1-type ATP synthase assembly protein I [Paenibacillus shirakamiensis]|uniref:F0F1-type ATP synthase assembly protein I n=1 Tax=Paenibacillus shirakamiensis TaxID=1265935 RepID=A0ABS4JJE3_9BACL|nr:AtpZ/AtpI family protein [Paenibacillus shirakamiensis]MBP2001823.1 F0F1-type ATP synthase assembly protein I [Paenibacillus shirakamiensis]
MKRQDKSKKSEENSSGALKAMGLVSAIGIDLAACTLGGFYLGSWMDKNWGLSGIGTAFGVLLGVFIGALSIIAIIKAVMGESHE